MKNVLGKKKSLKLYNKNSVRVYAYCKLSNGFIWERTYDSNGNELTHKDSTGFSDEYTRDSNGKILTYKDSKGYSYKCTRDSNGNELTFKDSNGVTRGFDIPKYTMEELVEKLENFKIKK